MRHKFPTALLLLARASAAPTGALQPDYVLPSLPDAERPSTPGESPVTHAMQARARSYIDSSGETRRVIMLAYFTPAYSSLMERLLCSIARNDIFMGNFVAVADSAEACAALSEGMRPMCVVDPEARARHLRHHAVQLAATSAAPPSADKSSDASTADYGTNEFREIVYAKPSLARRALRLGLDVIFIDADVVVIRPSMMVDELLSATEDFVIQNDEAVPPRRSASCRSTSTRASTARARRRRAPTSSTCGSARSSTTARSTAPATRSTSTTSCTRNC